VTALSLAEAESSYAPAERRQVVKLLKEHLARLNPDMAAAPPERYYKIVQKTADTIQDGMTEAKVNEIIGGPPHAVSHTVFVAPFSRKAMPVTLKQWWGEANLIEVHFEDASKRVIYTRILDGIDRRFALRGSE
jgi:hypothetical protein